MKTFLLLPFAAALVSAQPGQTVFPEQSLYDVGVRAEQAGRVEQAKLVFLTLASTYDTSPFTTQAKVEIGALCLFAEAQTKLTADDRKAAFSTFATVARVYPKSPLAKLATAQMNALDPEGVWKRLR